MRILHAASNPAGIPSELARSQRALGHTAHALSYVVHPFGYPSDRFFDYWKRKAKLTRHAAVLRQTLSLLPRYDVFHLTAGQTLLPFMLDLPLLRIFKKTVVIHFHGCDVRQVALAQGQGMVHCRECQLRPNCSLEHQLWRQRIAERFADVLLCSTPDLTLVLPRARYVPNPIDLSRWHPTAGPGRPRGAQFTVVHAPSRPALKGTEHVVRAVDDLKDSGYPVDLRLLVGVPHDEVRAIYESADLLVDQLLIGWYGVVAIEAMALRKPVVAYLEPDLARRFGDPPLLHADRDSLKAVLARAIESPARLAELADRGFAYVRATHDARRVAADLLDVYREAGARG